jgi:hypothetical protein
MQSGEQVVAPEVDLDALGLLADRRKISVRFGAIEVGPALKSANMSSAVNKMPDADLVLDLERASTPPDYLGGLAVVAEERGQRFPRFTGSVVSASPTIDGVTVRALGGISLAESLISGMTARGMPTFELVYVLARSGGLRDEQLNIDGLDTLPRETFEVIAPLDGVELDHSVDFGGVRFLPADVAVRAIAALDVGEDLRAAFEAPAYALALATTERALTAEEQGLAEIDVALAWLTARLRYGLATLPNGLPLPFERRASLAQPSRRDVVAVRGLLTTRQWLRRPATAAEPRTMALAPDGARLDPDLPPLTLQDRLALLALARATREPDPLARVHALFEAIEFYASGVTTPKLFTRSALRALVQGLPPSFTDTQRERIAHLVATLNRPPLLEQLMHALDVDAVPIATGEVDLLWRLRKLRNDVVHGRGTELPATEDVEYATSLVARMLVYRAATRAAAAEDIGRRRERRAVAGRARRSCGKHDESPANRDQ